MSNSQRAGLPPEITSVLVESTLEERELGRAGNRLVRGRARYGRGVYLKAADGEVGAELLDEAERLRWIDGRLPVPAVLATAQRDGWVFVVLSALQGVPAHEVRGTRAVVALARAMRSVHALPSVPNPFTGIVEHELEEAERRVAAGEIDHDGFLEEVGSGPREVLRNLLIGPPVDELVFTHGDLCLPNVLISAGIASGIVDWALAGIADPHRDFMSAELTIRRNLDESSIETFYTAYGRDDIDPARTRYFWLLDKFTNHRQPQSEQ
ncbi:MAG TPA: aminoglycoside 3'-phosphotransferase [Microthrixaceae bacterium]|nr:aminoglycoside 3'-phosphotransferase [Microthrixaceae bacterium]HMT62150.1 aminoglycoside 3'-phosphotransferase [Microthrixaceae bacterium]